MKIFNDTTETMARALDVRMASQRVIASNLANIDTPGYAAQRVDFDASMARAQAGDENPVQIRLSTEQAAMDGNNVDMDAELSQMTRNKLLYNVTAQLLSAKFRQLNTVMQADQ